MQPVANLVIAERFRLNRQLGRGGMGSVWHATHLALDIPCAVKFIEGDYVHLPEAQARFEREAKAAAQLRSPHVVQILDHGVFQGTPYIAMELLDGEDLGKRLARIGRLPPQELCTIITQVCRALTRAHAAGIVHRDLKPDNIFLVRDDDREIAKVLDFGIAKAQSTAIEGSGTKTGAMLGTPYYMSPEQAQGTKAVDHRSDLWSLGVIVYQAVTGRLPFESEALGDLLVKIIVAPVPVPSQVAPDLPAAFDRFWAKAAERDPMQRYQSAKELAEGLSLVFGQSQLTDVMDRAQIRAVMASDPGVPGGTMPMRPANTPPAHGGPEALAYPATPQPYPGTPQPYAGTPQPGAGQVPAGVLPTTGAPIAHTFGGTGGAGPGHRKGLAIGIAGAALVALVIGVVGVTYAVRGRSAAAGADTATAAARQTASGAPSSVPSASVVEVAAPPPSSAAAPISSSPPIEKAPAEAPRPAARPAAARTHGGAAQAAPAKPAPEPAKKPQAFDLGI